MTFTCFPIDIRTYSTHVYIYICSLSCSRPFTIFLSGEVSSDVTTDMQCKQPTVTALVYMYLAMITICGVMCSLNFSLLCSRGCMSVDQKGY